MFLASRLTTKSSHVLVTLVIFSLASGVLGGLLFYMDSTSTEVLQEMTEFVPIDMEIRCNPDFYSSSDLTLDTIRNVVLEQSIVTSAEIIAVIEGFDPYVAKENFRGYVHLGVDPSFFTTFKDSIWVNSNGAQLLDNSCYIEENLFHYNQLAIGDNYTVSVYYHGEGYETFRVNKTFTVAGSFRSTIYSKNPDIDNPSSKLGIITTREGLHQSFDQIGHRNSDGIFDRVWTVFDSSFITGSNPSYVEESLSEVKKKVEQRILPLASVSDFEILGVVYGYNSWSSTMTVIAISFSIPTIVMGIMLVQYDTQLHEDERRRDLGTLTTRGSSGWQSFNWVLSSAFITGFLGSIGAILTGGLAAILSGGAREFLVFNESAASNFSLLLEPISVISVFLFSFVLGVIVSLPYAVRALIMTPEEAHSIIERRVLLGKEKISNPIWEIVAVAISGVLMIPVLSVILYSNFQPTAFALFAILVVLLFGIFITSVSRVLSRPAPYLKSGILNFVKRPSLKVSATLISRYSKFYKSSETMSVMFIALMFTSALFSSFSAETGSIHMRELYMFDTGADVVIDSILDADNVTLALLDNITSVDGVLNASGMFRTGVHVSYLDSTISGLVQKSTPLPVYAIQPNKWIDSTFIEPYFSLSGDLEHTVRLLAENQTNVISSFRPNSALSDTGLFHENLTLNFIGPPTNETFYAAYSFNATIVDTLSDSNYRNSINYMPGEDSPDFLLMNITYVHSWLNTSRVSRFYVNIDESKNITRILSDLRKIAPRYLKVISSQERIDSVLDSRTGQSINGVYSLNVVFSLVYLTIGMMVVNVVRSRKLQKQYSILRAFGTNSSSVLASILLDTMIGILVGTIIGLFIGYYLTTLILDLPLVFLGVSVEILWSRLPISLAIPFGLLSLILIVAVVSSIVTVFISTKRALSRNIADDFRHE
ncbi:MAG: FtsX-like permease family protein [Candidatus Thorarchaeota archaeon]